MSTFNLKELMGILDHETSTHGLHPILQANWADAQSVLDDLGGACQSIATIGMEDLSFARDAVIANRTRNQEWCEENGYTPKLMYLTQRVDLYEVPGPIVVTIGSSNSPRVATLVVVYHEVDENGYGDWITATGLVHRVFDDQDEADAFLDQVARAIKTQRAVMRQIESTRSEASARKVKIAPAF